MEDTKVSYIATPEQRFLNGGLTSHSNSKSPFKIVHNVQEINRPNKEPLITSTFPDYPWQQVATDLFQLRGADYLVIP